MKIISGSFYLLLILLMMTGCVSADYLNELELIAYVQDETNGLIKSQEGGGITFTLSYRPNDLIVLQDVGANSDSSDINTAINQYSDYVYFVLSMEIQGKNALYGVSRDMSAFSEHLQTLSFRMGDKARIVTSRNDTIPVVDYIFDRTFGMGATTLMFVFNKEKLYQAESFTFQLKDFGMHSGDQHFHFKVKDINDVPRLKELVVSNIVKMTITNIVSKVERKHDFSRNEFRLDNT